MKAVSKYISEELQTKSKRKAAGMDRYNAGKTYQRGFFL
jgi:hypothetical protein